MRTYTQNRIFLLSMVLILTTIITDSLSIDNEWTYLGLGPDPRREAIHDIIIDPTDSYTLYVGTYSLDRGINIGHIFITENRGDNWASAFSDKRVESIAINSQNSDILHAAAWEHGILKSTNGGESWRVMFTGIAGPELFRTIVADPTNPNILYAKTASGDFYKSVNYAWNWDKRNIGLLTDSFFSTNHSIVIDHSDDSTLYVGTFHGVFKSTDQADSWTRLNEYHILSITMDPNNSNILYCTIEDLPDSRGLVKSTNAGDNWETIGPIDIRCFDILVHPENSDIIFAASVDPGGVLMSCDEGTTWTSIGLDTMSILSLAISNDSPNILYAGSGYDGLFVRTIPDYKLCGILGDVNGDEVVNSSDALIIMSCDVGLDVSGFCPMNCGDVNDDGFVNSTDALIVLSYDVGMDVPFSIGSTGCPDDVNPCAGCGP